MRFVFFLSVAPRSSGDQPDPAGPAKDGTRWIHIKPMQVNLFYHLVMRAATRGRMAE
jgi:hypothetical protein